MPSDRPTQVWLKVNGEPFTCDPDDCGSKLFDRLPNGYYRCSSCRQLYDSVPDREEATDGA